MITFWVVLGASMQEGWQVVKVGHMVYSWRRIRSNGTDLRRRVRKRRTGNIVYCWG